MRSLPTKAFAPCASMYSLPSHGIRITHTQISSTESSGGFDAEWEDSMTGRALRRLGSRSWGRPLTKGNLRALDEEDRAGSGGLRARGGSGLRSGVKRVVGQPKRLFSGSGDRERGERRRHAAREAGSPVGRDAQRTDAIRDVSKDAKAKGLEKTEVEGGQAEKAGRDPEKAGAHTGVELLKNYRVVAWLESLPGPEKMAGPHDVM